MYKFIIGFLTIVALSGCYQKEENISHEEYRKKVEICENHGMRPFPSRYSGHSLGKRNVSEVLCQDRLSVLWSTDEVLKDSKGIMADKDEEPLDNLEKKFQSMASAYKSIIEERK